MRLSDRSIAVLRILASALGGAAILLSLLSGAMGLFSVDGTGIGRNQALLLLVGVAMLAAALLGRRFVRAYSSAAVLLLNTVLALAVLELAALVLFKVHNAAVLSDRAMRMEQCDFERIQRIAVSGRYAPWVLWRAEAGRSAPPWSSDSLGRRITPGNSGSAEVEVFIFGGSGAWGLGVPDSCTIAAYLGEYLDDSLAVDVDVYNMAQLGYVSMQELIELMMLLRRGRVPDYAVFYGGFNDVASAFQNGRAGCHYDLQRIKARIEGESAETGSGGPLLSLFRSSNTFQLLSSLGVLRRGDAADSQRLPWYSDSSRAGALAEDAVALYLEQAEMAGAIADSYGFDAIFVWQPNIWCGAKDLTPEERRLSTAGIGRDESWRRMVVQAYSIYGSAADSLPGAHSFASVYDDCPQSIFTDHAGCHVTPEGNAIAAERLAGLLAARRDSVRRSM